MSELTVTVIIPAYRAARTIHRPIKSLLAQTRPPDEILVIDDGSPDDLNAALSTFPAGRITLIRKSNGGAASARNLGIEKAQGELIAFLDADDYWEPCKLDRQLEVLRAHPEVALVASRYHCETPDGGRTGPYPEIAPRDLGRVLIVSGESSFELATRIWTGTVLVRRSSLGDERFVSGLEPAEDRDLWVRLINRKPVYFDACPMATLVLEPGSLSRSSIDVDCGNMLRVVRRHAGLLGPKGLRKWEAQTFGRWAGNLLIQGKPRDALRYAVARLRRKPFAIGGWWIVAKSGAVSFLFRVARGEK
ncbi:UDP-Glc:alpha-D-GlcNAc-diphosphoundecaprenol beta-1,3-glucosyltransferase WfgD [Aquisphaera giovannonii]|uniref:UDP-Glc:alpha-D-GlcNAc-diphosphoundecaprenol beta-1,3-glucosyltransferase WfgD n=1 Tax=Aquisphaera giovannonii TaxID=406548 RepID=A0A5B9WC82_9BACT|nr:glycosyltransferase family A protein [Aquisphaera giovannonii]QEH37839.1 UDP-Glc:alpha-D-GlcNAc-diphosphoundecaprenol beta-1,3-glucosyltransferase WfgD [Aquisphaera giovannonii]